ncbi:hypothetical protein GCM10017600_09100 [Streptosporangium carneum]|uniref:Uncharacterized protein n=1 Tax=Streptosporangium carneum TaxID=47481 RepID=A0A9W6HY16_9ACTN|nr:hypothetical protein GCM10017600_09100 [Streptosporangium carneum]
MAYAARGDLGLPQRGAAAALERVDGQLRDDHPRLRTASRRRDGLARACRAADRACRACLACLADRVDLAGLACGPGADGAATGIMVLMAATLRGPAGDQKI